MMSPSRSSTRCNRARGGSPVVMHPLSSQQQVAVRHAIEAVHRAPCDNYLLFLTAQWFRSMLGSPLSALTPFKGPFTMMWPAVQLKLSSRETGAESRELLPHWHHSCLVWRNSPLMNSRGSPPPQSPQFTPCTRRDRQWRLLAHRGMQTATLMYSTDEQRRFIAIALTNKSSR